MVMVLSLVPSAFAADGDTMVKLTADKATVKPGETVTFTYTLDHDLEYMTALDIVLRYDATLFKFVNTDINGSVWFDNPSQNTAYETGSQTLVRIRQYNDDNEETIVAGKICSVTFASLDNISGTQTASFFNGTTGLSRSSIEVDGETLYVKNGAFDHGESDPITVTISSTGTVQPKPTATGYSVSMAADQQVAAGDKVSIPVTVASSEKGITGFNAYDMTFTYDPEALTLTTTSDSAANLTVEDNNGTVRVRRYGKTMELGTALTLDFTANKATSSTVTLTAAKFDIDANSINFDAPDATVTDADTKVTGLWNVTLPAGFESTSGANTVENGGSFIFKALDTHYRYYLKITTNGSTQLVEMKKATYTIENVTDNVTVTVSDRVAKTYTLKFVVDDRSAEYFGTEPLTLADLGIENETVTVTYPNDYQFIVKFPGTGRYAGASVEPSSNSFKSYTDRLENGDYNYVLEGSKLVGDENDVITITIGVYIKTDRDKFNILVTGDTADFDADNPRTFYSGENYTFKLNKSEYYDYEISASYKTKNLSGSTVTEYKPVKDNEDGTYTVINCPMADLTIHITKTAKAVDPSTVTVNQYVELNEKTVFLVRVAGQLSGGKVFTYDGSPMYKTTSYGYSTYSWLVIVEKGQTLTKEDVLQLIKLEDGAAAGSVGIDTDVNQSGKADVNDAQLVYDIYNRVYNDGYETVSMEKFLRADQNADGVLDSQDAVTLAGKLHV